MQMQIAAHNQYIYYHRTNKLIDNKTTLYKKTPTNINRYSAPNGQQKNKK